MRMDRNSLLAVVGLALVALIASKGVFGFGSADSVFAFFWPTLFVVPVGIFFHWLYFFLGQRGVGLLVPGGIVLSVGVVCQIATVFDSWSVMWPGFIMAPAVGLFELYLFGSRNRWLLIPINILTGLAMLFFAVYAVTAVFNHLYGLRSMLVLAIAAAGIGYLFLRRKKDSYASQPWE